MNVADPPSLHPDAYPDWLLTQPDAAVLTYARHTDIYLRVSARIEVDRRILTLPHIVEDVEGLTSGLCDYCGRGFAREDFLSIHLHFNDDGTCRNGFTADRTCECGETFDCLSRASKHRIQHNCRQTRLRREAMKAKRQEELKQLYCEPCKHQSYDAKQYAKHCETKHHHKTTHRDEFDCKECGLHFEFKSQLDRHLASKAHRPEPEVLRCDVCKVDFRCPKEKARHLAGKQHIYKADPSKRPTLTCEVCGITRPSHGQYLAHLETAKHRKAVACLEDPSSPDDADA